MRRFFRDLFEALERGHRFVTKDIWRIGKPGEEAPRGFIIKNIRVVILLVRGIIQEQFLLRASALTFATLIFIVPFLTFMFFFIQAFNLGEGFYRYMSVELDHALDRLVVFLEPESAVDDAEAADAAEEGPSAAEDGDLPEYGPEAPPAAGALTALSARGPPYDGVDPADEEAMARARAAQAELDNEMIKQRLVEWLLPDFDQKVEDESFAYRDPVQILVEMAEQGASNRQTLGLSGLVLVLTTVFGMMRNVEWSFNTIWGVTRSRSFLRTAGDYMMITMLLPFVAAAVIGITAALESDRISEVLGNFSVVLRGFQFAIVCLTFSLIYFLVPNTRVRKRYAILGGLVGGGLWILNSWVYVAFGMGLARYTLFFASFALFPVFMMWIYTSWIILLFGALVVFAYQNESTFATERLAHDASHAYREAIGVRAMVEMARRFRDGAPGVTVPEAASQWNVPTRLLNDALDCLVKAKFVIPCLTDPVSYQPARAPEATPVIEVVRALREAGHDPSLLRQDESFEAIYRGLDHADPRTLQSSIADLVDAVEQAERTRQPKEVHRLPRVL